VGRHSVGSDCRICGGEAGIDGSGGDGAGVFGGGIRGRGVCRVYCYNSR
jgi:hypothetical protein